MEENVSDGAIAMKNYENHKKKKTKKKTISFTSQQKIILVLLGAVEFTSVSIMSIMAPFFPKEAAVRGVSESLSGTIFGYYAFIMVISAPIFGALLPKVGYKNLLLLGVLTSSLSSFLIGAVGMIDSYSYFVVGMFITRGIEALGASAYTTASFVSVWTIYPENCSAVRGFLEIFVGLGLSAGPAVGGIFYTKDRRLWVAILRQKIIEPPRSSSIIKLSKISPVFVTSVVTTVVSMTWSFLEPTLAVHLEQFQLSPKNIGVIFLLLSATYGISCPFFGWAADSKTKNWLLMVIGLFFNGLNLVFLSSTIILNFLPSTLWLDILALATLGVSVAMALNPTYQAMTDEAIHSGFPDDLSTHSLIAGLWFCAHSLGEVFGPILGGVLLESYGFPVTTTVFSVLNFFTASIVTGFFFGRKSKKKTKKRLIEVYTHKNFDI